MLADVEAAGEAPHAANARLITTMPKSTRAAVPPPWTVANSLKRRLEVLLPPLATAGDDKMPAPLVAAVQSGVQVIGVPEQLVRPAKLPEGAVAAGEVAAGEELRIRYTRCSAECARFGHPTA